ncbi:peroxiredoxin Q [Athelia psychrophila]|uniref:thioredoxin-dependent peroxiredoxin n=1 Tax=Athelia psychrophila TaxID=1759441 RepID=A0A166WAM9_9AGAM|nr:peroxiredoxin Q [Fibularhizoctonia sp. CBS 109695]
MQSLVGQPAPSFTTSDSNGAPYTLTPASVGVPIVLFFYPKSGSYGCTKEVCQFQAMTEKETFKRAGVLVVGVSPDPVDKQKAFVEKQKISYPLLSDVSGEARKAYGVTKHMLGPSTRTTFVIDKTGTVRAVFDAMMNFAGHGKFVDKELDKLEAEAASATAVVDAPASEAEAAPVASEPDA